MHLPHRLNRTVIIRAKPETVFNFFTDSDRWAKWWGPGSTIDAQPGGKVYIRHPNGIETLGDVVEVHAPDRIVFTYGFATGKPIPPGSSRVTIRLEPDAQGTRLNLLHEFADSAVRDEHVQGWRFQLSLFSNAVADEAYAGATAAIDAWFAGWTTKDHATRAETFARIASPDISFRDRYAALSGVDDVTAHATASQRFMPGIELKRDGDTRHCQGSLLSNWIATDKDGQVRMSGSSVYVFNPDGKIASVTSFTNY